jgi:radical SAM enzyme (rSAM/lipoprotein system)
MVSDLSLRKRIALSIHARYKKNERQLHKLNYLFWECTLRCNLSCRHCGSDCKRDSTVSDMPVGDFLHVIDEIIPIVSPAKTLIVFSGGEPLLRKDLEEAGLALYNRGFAWGMVTNGLLLDEKRLKSLINAGLRSITVSLDGFEDSHNWLRMNASSFKKAYHAISLLTKTSNLRFDVVTCVHEKNIHELNSFKEFLVQTGLKEWRIFTIFPIGRAGTDADLQLSPQNFKALFDFIALTRKTSDIKLNYGCEGFLGAYEGEVRDNFFFCRAGINVASILADGSISACPNMRGNFIQGNIYTDKFVEIWNNKFKLHRDRSWTKTGMCAECNFFSYCQGNGLHLHNEETGELLFCHLRRIQESELSKPF